MNDLFNTKKLRRPFKTSTKKRVWMKARKSDPDKWRSGFIKTSYCMNPRCKKKLIWGDKNYDFDHHDNNPYRNSEKNCWLVCLHCHRKHTVYGTKRVNSLSGERIRIKKKVGYKKSKKKRSVKKVISRKSFDGGIFGDLRFVFK